MYTCIYIYIVFFTNRHRYIHIIYTYIYIFGLPPTQDSSHKWRFSSGFPTKLWFIILKGDCYCLGGSSNIYYPATEKHQKIYIYIYIIYILYILYIYISPQKSGEAFRKNPSVSSPLWSMAATPSVNPTASPKTSPEKKGEGFSPIQVDCFFSPILDSLFDEQHPFYSGWSNRFNII